MSKRHSQEDVELNVAAMLDMAFQLLTFFILTFRPPPAEGEIGMRLPPPQAVLGAGQAAAGEDASKDPKDVKPVATLTVSLGAGQDGLISAISLGVPTKGMTTIPPQPPPVQQLDGELKRFFGSGADSFEQVVIQAAPNLRYGELMRVVEICSKQTYSDGTRLSKLSFVTLPGSVNP
jgi:biopolymer transport protein ExbD